VFLVIVKSQDEKRILLFSFANAIVEGMTFFRFSSEAVISAMTTREDAGTHHHRRIMRWRTRDIGAGMRKQGQLYLPAGFIDARATMLGRGQLWHIRQRP
jgi:hypothetical protein